MQSKKSIIGIGNALMDIVVQLPNDEILAKNGLPRGSMVLVDFETSNDINAQTTPFERIWMPGGSVANTIDGLANLGIETAFVGKVGNDPVGDNYAEGLMKLGVRPHLFKSDTPTGIAMALVSPDSERTFATYLGAAVELNAEEITIDLFRDYDFAYVEGYLVQNHELVRKAVEMARKAGLTTALDLASYNVVEENLAFLKEIIKEHVDIIFANEDEAKAFTGLEAEAAVHAMLEYCDIAVVKTGKNGSLICNGEDLFRIEIFGDTCVDTTGAGDLYAAGFLYGLSCNFDIETSGRIASVVAGHVVKVYGARMDAILWNDVRSEVEKIFT
jgi:sugar/nucleoside kinase (ribokinase family)